MSSGAITTEERKERNGLDLGDPVEDVYLGTDCYHENRLCRQGIDLSETVPRRAAQMTHAACFACILTDYSRSDIGSAWNYDDPAADPDSDSGSDSEENDDAVGPDRDADDAGEVSGGEDWRVRTARALQDGATSTTTRSCLSGDCIGPTPQAKRSSDGRDVWECLKCGRTERIR